MGWIDVFRRWQRGRVQWEIRQLAASFCVFFRAATSHNNKKKPRKLRGNWCLRIKCQMMEFSVQTSRVHQAKSPHNCVTELPCGLNRDYGINWNLWAWNMSAVFWYTRTCGGDQDVEVLDGKKGVSLVSWVNIKSSLSFPPAIAVSLAWYFTLTWSLLFICQTDKGVFRGIFSSDADTLEKFLWCCAFDWERKFVELTKYFILLVDNCELKLHKSNKKNMKNHHIFLVSAFLCLTVWVYKH